MDENVVVPLICDFLLNCDEAIKTFLRNENDFDFVGVSCCFVRRNVTRIQNYFESIFKLSNYCGDEFAAYFRITRTSTELLTREMINTGRIPSGNAFGRLSILHGGKTRRVNETACFRSDLLQRRTRSSTEGCSSVPENVR